MSYLTPAQLVEGSGSLLEIAQLYELAPELLTATIANADRSAWSADEIAAADAALASIEDKLIGAASEVDSYLVRRGYALPLSAVAFPVLATWTRMIARYHIQQQRDRTSEDTGRIERDYRSALRSLEAVAAGERGLGAGDPLFVAPSAGELSTITVDSESRVFSRGSLRRL
jgi:phage gp36-like protein